ncbi:MAG: chromosomal replication initiator protein DnaA [Puniceicoccaceae bacterium]
MSQTATISSQTWFTIRESLRVGLPAETFSMWFEPLTCEETDQEILKLSAPNDFIAIWVEDNYLDYIQTRLFEVVGKNLPVQICVPASAASETAAPATTSAQPSASTPERPRPFSPAATSGTQTSTAVTGLNPKNTFDNFVVGANTHLAHAASIAVANAPGRAYNPLFIYGETGLGKTHLMHSIAHQVLRTNPESIVAYVSTEKFTNKFIRAIQENQLPKFRRFYRRVDILLIDDIQFLANRERIQEEFFHTFNELFESGKQIVLTSDRPAGEISKLEKRLLSRFQWGLMADVQPPDIETRMAILSKKARAIGIELDETILSFLAEKVTRNVRRIEGALTRIAGYTTLIRDPLTVDNVARLLHDILAEEVQHEITIEKIQSKTAEYSKLAVEELKSRRRPARIVVPRQIAMYLCRILTNHSLAQIGEAFGGRDHGTVIHSIKTVEALMEQDESVRHSVDYLTKQLSKAS